MASMDRRREYNYTRKSHRYNSTGTVRCNVCGQLKDTYHNSKACVELWIKQCDAELAKAKEGRP